MEAQVQVDAKPSSQKKSPFFTVVIPVRNEEINIGRCLASLSRLHFSPALFEVVVVDNGSTDGTREAAAKFHESLQLRILDLPGQFISALRNAGAAVGRSPYLAFLDADCEVRRHWLSAAEKIALEGNPGIFGAFYLIPAGSSWIARYWYGHREAKPAGEVSFLPSGDLFISRRLFESVGGFDESIQTNEDYELCQRVRASGLPVRCYPELAVIHWGTPQSLTRFFAKNRWHGSHVLQVFLRNLPKLYNLKPILLATYTLACLIGILVGIVYSFVFRSLWLIGIFGGAMLAPAIVLGLAAAFTWRKPLSAIPMSVLYFTYALARASCLVGRRSWSQR